VKERSQASPAPKVAPRALDVFRSTDFRAIVLAGLVLGLPTMSDAFIYLALQQQLQVGVMAFPLFYVGTSLFTAMFAMPFGRLADRFGRTTVLLGGHVLLALVYLTLFVPQAPVVAVVVTLALLGAYYAASDGVLTAMAAAVLAPSASGTGLSLLATATNVSRLIASVLFGFLWSRAGLGSAIGVYLVALTVAIVCAGIVLFRARGVTAQSRG
jgi:predicted MFS family arabinose efflux permease